MRRSESDVEGLSDETQRVLMATILGGVAYQATETRGTRLPQWFLNDKNVTSRVKTLCDRGLLRQVRGSRGKWSLKQPRDIKHGVSPNR